MPYVYVNRKEEKAKKQLQWVVHLQTKRHTHTHTSDGSYIMHFANVLYAYAFIDGVHPPFYVLLFRFACVFCTLSLFFCHFLTFGLFFVFGCNNARSYTAFVTFFSFDTLPLGRRQRRTAYTYTYIQQQQPTKYYTKQPSSSIMFILYGFFGVPFCILYLSDSQQAHC